MDDLDITRLCARAAGYQPIDRDGYVQVGIRNEAYDPLHNRAQNHELVERLRPDIVACNDGDWFVCLMKPRHEARDANLLRAICLCAARAQQSKESQK